ncbi:MAG: hypothetical protein HYZ27_06765 [Deltaproteobacteria bacterium]|nr:hypothetical protein [Deltaproteobacteria bacterium]
MSVELAETPAAAREILARQRFDLVIAAFEGDEGIELLRWCREHHPSAARALWADYSELPEVIRRRADRVVAAVLAKPGTPDGLRHAIRQLLNADISPASRSDPTEDPSVRGAFVALIEELTKIHGHVIRSRTLVYADAAMTCPTLQLVVPMGPERHAVKTAIASEWRGVVPAPWHSPWRRHPVERLVGFRSGLEELHHRATDEGSKDVAFVALLPWAAEPRVTVVLGVIATEDPNRWETMLDELHRLAVSRSATLFIPGFEESTNRSLVEFNRDYDWVVTRRYVGPDRRGRTPRLFDRFLVVGQRARVPRGASDLSESFVDRIPRLAKVFVAAFLVLTIIDGVLTHRFVTSGAVHELNPVMRAALSLGPWAFLAIKVGIGAVAFRTVARLHFHAIGRGALLALLGVYAIVVAYWGWVL